MENPTSSDPAETAAQLNRDLVTLHHLFIAPRERSELGGIPNLYSMVSATSGWKSVLSGCKVPWFDGDCGQISPTKMGRTTKNHILRQTARTEFFRWHFHFFLKYFFEYGFMQNVLRDFQKQIMHENGPFSRPFFCHIWMDMANKKYIMTISMEKGRKCTSQIFYFWNFITEIFAKLNERFSKIMK